MGEQMMPLNAGCGKLPFQVRLRNALHIGCTDGEMCGLAW